MNNLLLLAETADQSTLDNLSVSGISSIIGMGIVFLVLALLIGCIYLFSYVLSRIESSKDCSVADNVEQIVEAPEVKPLEIMADRPDEDAKRIVAAITAALAVAAFDRPNVRFVVRKIRKL